MFGNSGSDTPVLNVRHGSAWEEIVGGSVVVDATTSVKGIVLLAQGSDVLTGTATDKVITPSALSVLIATTARRGLVQLATEPETATGTEDAKAVTPKGLKGVTDTLAKVADAFTTITRTKTIFIGAGDRNSFLQRQADDVVRSTQTGLVLLYVEYGTDADYLRSVVVGSKIILNNVTSTITAVDHDVNIGVTAMFAKFTLATALPFVADNAEGTMYFTSVVPGATDFLKLTDTPDAYTGDGGKVLKVNPGATGIEFSEVETTDTTLAGSTINPINQPSEATINNAISTGITIPADHRWFYLYVSGSLVSDTTNKWEEVILFNYANWKALPAITVGTTGTSANNLEVNFIDSVLRLARTATDELLIMFPTTLTNPIRIESITGYGSANLPGALNATGLTVSQVEALITAQEGTDNYYLKLLLNNILTVESPLPNNVAVTSATADTTYGIGTAPVTGVGVIKVSLPTVYDAVYVDYATLQAFNATVEGTPFAADQYEESCLLYTSPSPRD